MKKREWKIAGDWLIFQFADLYEFQISPSEIKKYDREEYLKYLDSKQWFSDRAGFFRLYDKLKYQVRRRT